MIFNAGFAALCLLLSLNAIACRAQSSPLDTASTSVQNPASESSTSVQNLAPETGTSVQNPATETSTSVQNLAIETGTSVQNPTASTPASLQKLDPFAFQQALTQAESPYLIDCRTPGEVALGALPKARNIDFRSPNFQAEVEKLDRNRPVFVYCQAGGRSAQSAALLQSLGFTHVIDMAGGYSAYKAQLKEQ